GRLIETVVLIELLRRQAREPGLEIGYWKDHRQREVDFVLRQKGRFTQLVQVAWSMEDFDRRDRELGNLAAASETLRCKDLLLITWEEEGTETVGGRSIRLVPLWRWLLHESGPHQTSQRA
ncbi:MAG TPA: DUF4143 domain-containing protein, partial [Thermoplasmata archaeon]|nr:DUF4143 domain-containing protein [Thermoplasmata archaeon]